MFDPERDVDRGRSTFYRRLVIIALIGTVISLAIWPAIRTYSSPINGDRTCIAIKDGWHTDRVVPPETDVVHANAYVDWINGPGECVPTARHLLILTGIKLLVLLGILAVAGIAIRRHTRNGRPGGAAVRVETSST